MTPITLTPPPWRETAQDEATRLLTEWQRERAHVRRRLAETSARVRAAEQMEMEP